VTNLKLGGTRDRFFRRLKPFLYILFMPTSTQREIGPRDGLFLVSIGFRIAPESRGVSVGVVDSATQLADNDGLAKLQQRAGTAHRAQKMKMTYWRLVAFNHIRR
jgi:hypothetical protein